MRQSELTATLDYVQGELWAAALLVWSGAKAIAHDIAGWHPSILAGLIGVFGTICVTLVLFLGNRREAKWKATMELFEEFNDFNMSNARNLARVFLSIHFDKDYQAISRLPRAADVGDDMRGAHLAVMRFYERLSVMQRSRRLIDRTLFDLFGSIFASWWSFSYSTQLAPTDWQAAREIEKLRAWMECQAEKKGRMDEWTRWLRNGIEERPEDKRPGNAPVPMPMLVR